MEQSYTLVLLAADSSGSYCLAGVRVEKALNSHGAVPRTLGSVDKSGSLLRLQEIKDITRAPGGIEGALVRKQGLTVAGQLRVCEYVGLHNGCIPESRRQLAPLFSMERKGSFARTDAGEFCGRAPSDRADFGIRVDHGSRYPYSNYLPGRNSIYPGGVS